MKLVCHPVLRQVPFIPRSKPIKVPGIGFPLPQGLDAVNQEKYDFRVKASPSLAKVPRPALDFADLMTQEERLLLRKQQPS